MERGLSKIISTIKTWAEAHPQISTFKTKPLTEFVASESNIYPLMWLDYSGIAPSAQLGQWTITMPFYFIDRVERNFSNLDSVMSSTLFMVDDFLTEFNDNHCEYGFDFQYNASVTPVGSPPDYDDLVSGWMVSVSIQTGMSRNESKMPT